MDPNSFDEHVAGVRERFNAWVLRTSVERDLQDEALATFIEETR